MNKLISISLAAMLCGAGYSASAQDTTKKPDAMKESMPMKDGMAHKDAMPMKHGMGMKDGMHMDMTAMDTNHDGMISKAEFMKYHESMFARMKKGSNGMVSMKDMEMMNDGMMKK